LPQRSALNRLESVRKERQPFERLSRLLIAQTLEQYLPGEGLIVEIGMGDGQLRDRLPEAVLPRVIHTEPDAAVSRAYRRQHRNLNVIQAAAERLPFESESVAAVIGLCVLDVVPEGPTVVRELSRILKPGGRVVHWLDMSTVLGAVVDSLWSVRLVPFPNWFSDPSAADWPDDLLLIQREQLQLVVAALHGAGSPVARPLAQYLATFSSPPVAPGAPTQELIQLQESHQLRTALMGAFQMAFELAPPEARAKLANFQVQPLSTARHFEGELRSWFNEESGFRVELSGVERAWEITPRQGPELAYRSCFIGEQRHLPRVPDVRLCADAASGSEQTLLELGIYSFVATKLGS
jgi:SAM-dependent methyltransferase